MRSSPVAIVVLAAVLSVTTGCRKGDGNGNTVGAQGVLEVVSQDPQGVQGEGNTADAVYDFGTVFMGQWRAITVEVANSGRGRLTITTLEKSEGDDFAVVPSAVIPEGGVYETGQRPEAGPAFRVGFDGGITVDTAGTAKFQVLFAPEESNVISRNYETKILLRAEGTASGKETAVLTLRGVAEAGLCELPAPVVKNPDTGVLTLDFGAVATKQSFTQSVALRNPTNVLAKVLVGDIHGADASVFSFAPESVRGEFQLEPGQSREAVVAFNPLESKVYSAKVPVRASTECPTKQLDLVGQGVESILTWAPASVDCGYASPGTSVTREVVFTNNGLEAAQLSSFTVDKPGQFQVKGLENGGLVVPGNRGTATVQVTCTPTAQLAFSGVMAFNTNIPLLPSGRVNLAVRGGGPEIETSPRGTLNFGKVAYLPNVDLQQTRKLTVLNIGSRPNPVPAGVNPNLLLGTRNATTGRYGPPYFRVEPLEGTTADEFQVTMAPSYDPNVGLDSAAGKNSLELVVKVSPRSLGTKQARVVLFSNDSDEPELAVTLSASAQQVPDCRYTLTPATLDFGLMSPPNTNDLEFSIRNDLPAGSGSCLVGNVGLKAGSDPAFSLPLGELVGQEVAPGESLRVRVRAAPTTGPSSTQTTLLAIAGAIDVRVASTERPAAEVPVRATLGAACLNIAPDELDFGTVPLNCRSATKSFNIYNTCPGGDIRLTAIEISNNTPENEFQIVSNPMLAGTPVVVRPGAEPVQFTALYQPRNMGSDSGAFAIRAVQNNQDVTYVVSLGGAGDVNGSNTDNFKQDVRPKADILFIVDNSGSMSPIQKSLADNFSSFINYAQDKKVDYQLAIVTTDNAAFQGANGEPLVMTPSTPNVREVFARRVNVGTSGSATEKPFEQGLKALTPPLITSTNAGFIREDASLAVIAVTDEAEQSGNSIPFWKNQYLNIKGFNQSNLFSFNAIARFNSPTCHSGSVVDDGRLAQMVFQTDGIKEEVCNENWAKALEQLGKRAGGFKTNFFLTSVPDFARPTPITVEIGGQEVPQTDVVSGTKIWSYDSVQNSVNFDPNWVPEPGTSLDIHYFARCN